MVNAIITVDYVNVVVVTLERDVKRRDVLMIVVVMVLVTMGDVNVSQDGNIEIVTL